MIRAVLLNEIFIRMLRRLHHAECQARGPDRRATFLLTRETIGAARRLGLAPHHIAECMGVSVDSVRNRTAPTDGTISPELIRRLTGLTPAELNRRAALPLVQAVPDGSYRVSQFVACLLSIRQP